MRAIAFEEFGGPDKLRPMALPRPKPERGEVLVKVVAAGVNPVDWMIREGGLAPYLAHRFPVIPGWDVAGVVEEFGAGATRFRKGDRVFGCARKPSVQWGCYAEFVSVPEPALAAMPAKLLFEEAAGVPVGLLTAAQCLRGLRAGQTVLIHAAAGGVGHFAVQLAKHAGARVFGTAGSTGQSLILGLGAEAAIDYTREDFRVAFRRACAEGADLILDAVGGETLARSYELLKPGGRLCAIVDEPDAAAAAAHGAGARYLTVEPDGARLEELAPWFDRKKLRVQVHKIYPLAKAAEAQAASQERHVHGKLVLNL
jgi:NADPH:quinone reductase-like Zn-dependent oxidoreductase